MPLSEHEQRILEEIEKNLVDEDPRFARGVRRTTPRFDRSRRAKLGAGIFVLGLLVLIAFFATQELFVGVFAFGAMVAGIVLILGSSHALVNSSRTGGRQAGERMRDALADFQERIRRRYKKL
ncbi:MAG: DUF3040 domain-containing protein [Actinomycetota bacterium]